MTKLTFYKGDTDKVGRRDPSTGATTHVPERDCFGEVINSHVNVTKVYFGEKGDFYIIVPPARMQADMEFDLVEGDVPTEPVPDADVAAPSAVPIADAPQVIEDGTPGIAEDDASSSRRKR